MNFELVNDSHYNALASRLREVVPEFISVFDEDEVYLMLGEFARFLIDNINDEAVISHCADFINEAFYIGKHETVNAMTIQVFETLKENNFASGKIRFRLIGKALMIFDSL